MGTQKFFLFHAREETKKLSLIVSLPSSKLTIFRVLFTKKCCFVAVKKRFNFEILSEVVHCFIDLFRKLLIFYEI